MATQGIVSVVVDGETRVKAVAGSDGYNASLLAAEIRRNHLTTPEAVLEAAKRVNFGGACDLVVQGPNGNLFEGHEDLSDLYLNPEIFRNPTFNPRWKHGTADYVEVIRLQG